MPRSPSRPDPPQGYIRTTTKQPYHAPSPYDPHSAYLNPQVSPQHYVQTNLHPPAPRHLFSHDSYHRHPHGGEPYYHPYGSYTPHFHKPGFRHPHHCRPLPHPPAPPAPPAPPRPQQTRQAQFHTSSARPRSPRRPAFSHCSQAKSNSHSVPSRLTRSCRGTQPSRDDENEASSGHSRPEGEPCTQSLSLGSRSESEAQERTPSPVDPDGLRRWEEEHSQPLPLRASPGGGSSHEGEMVNDGGDESSIDPSLRNHSHSSHSSLSHEFDSHDSAADDMSLHDIRPDGINGAATEDAGKRIPNPQQRPNSEYYPAPHHQAQFAALAKETGSIQRGTLGLNSLEDGNPNERPPYSIQMIATCAIQGSPHEQLTLSELYTAMEERFSYYKNKKSWKNSVRHTLSLKEPFGQKKRPITEPGNGDYWVIVPDKPQGNKRVRKRNKKPGKRALAAMAAEQARLALSKEQELSATDVSTDSNISTDSAKRTDGELAIDPRLTRIPPAYSASVRGGHISGTLPANAGSYAAVTGAIPPPALERHLFLPWHGDDLVTSSIENNSSQPTVSASTESSKTSGTSGSVAGASSPVAPKQPGRASSSSPSAPEGNSTSGVERTSKTRVDRRYNPMTVGPSPPTPPRRSAFETLSAALEREGIGAKGSGGPASRGRRRVGRGNRRANDGDDSESDGDPSGDQSDDEDYSPRNRRR